MTNPTDREEGALSELGDKERRFVEDQRRIRFSAPSASDPWAEGQDGMISVSGVTARDLEKLNAGLLQRARKNALLAEAVEVLREFKSVEPFWSDPYGVKVCFYCGAIQDWEKRRDHQSKCLWFRSKGLLDKLGERE